MTLSHERTKKMNYELELELTAIEEQLDYIGSEELEQIENIQKTEIE